MKEKIKELFEGPHPSPAEQQILRKVARHMPTDYLKAIRTAADVALIRKGREEDR